MGIYCKEPAYGAKIRPEYPIIGHYKNLAIIDSVNGDHLYIEDENKVLQVGEYVEDIGLNYVISLPNSDYNKIMSKFKE